MMHPGYMDASPVDLNFLNYCFKRYELYVAAFLQLLQVLEGSFLNYVFGDSFIEQRGLHAAINEAKNFFMAILFK